jgi:hypothetical protein
VHKTIVTFLSIALVGIGGAMAGDPASAELAAIVEDAPAGAPVALFEFLPEGHAFELAQGERIVIGYLASCRQETIEGGPVQIGNRRSVVADGLVGHRVVPCDSGGLELTADEAGGSGVFLVRRVDSPGPEPDLAIHSTRPLFIGVEGSDVTIERLDRPGWQLTLPVADGRADFISPGKATEELARGALYRATAGGSKIIFRIDKLARSEAATLSRLVPF